MRWQLRLPDLGEGIHEAELVAWLVSPGERVTEDQTVLQVETDKSIAEIPSPLSGQVVACHGQEGDRLAVGDPLVVLEVESVPPALASGILPDPLPGQQQDGQQDLPQDAQQQAEATQTPVETVAADTATDARPEVQESAAVPAPSSDKPGLRDRDTASALEVATVAEAPPAIQALPTVRKLARELGVDLATLAGQGSGPAGRITAEDVRAAAAEPATPARAGEERIALRGIRRQIALNMARSFYTAPHAAVMDELEVSELVQLRRLLLPQAQAAGVHLTYLPFVVMAVIKALQAHPFLNASLDDEHQEIVLKREYNIGIATDTPDGLLVPVIAHAGRLPLFPLSREIARLVGLARDRKLAPSDTHNGTFTITNIGPLGGLWSVPIIRHPEVAILAVHRIQPRPIVEGDRIVVGQMLNLVLTFDHRVVDGADALRFLKDLIHYIQHPALLFLDPGQ